MGVVRNQCIASEVLFLDGISGTGKTMFAPLLASFARVELGRFDHIHEYLCILEDSKNIDTEAVAALMNMYADLALYNSMISRETNFRWRDLSGVFSNPHTVRYLSRLLVNDGNCVVDRIREERPIAHIISHQALSVMRVAFHAFGSRLKVIEMVRHPLYLLEHWCTYIDRFGRDPRDFSIWIQYQDQALPWFARGWEDVYLHSHTIDKVIYALEYFTRRADELVASLAPEQQKQILFVPFEHFVLNPRPFIHLIEKHLNTTATRSTARVLRQQKCPRSQVAAGPAKEIYKRYGWRKPPAHMSEADALAQKRQFAGESGATSSALEVLDRLSAQYEQRYQRWY